MLQVTALPTHHADLVCDVAYDYYGDRLATCSADQRIKIWRKDDAGKWDEEADWRAHDAPVTRLSWSHPEHHNLLASCSFDRSVKIWQEVKMSDTRSALGGQGATTTTTATTTTMMAGGTSHQRKWQEKGFLNDAKGSVRAVEFAPNQFGLKLASISTDSYLRVYTSLSPNHDDWQLTTSVHVPNLIQVEPFAPTNGDDARPTSNLSGLSGVSTGTAAASSSSTAPTHATGSGGSGGSLGKNNEAFGAWDLSFCKEPWWGMIVAVTCGYSGAVKIVDLSAASPRCILVLEPPSAGSASAAVASTNNNNNNTGYSNPFAQPQAQSYSSLASSNPTSSSAPPGSLTVTTVAWAPSMGRSYHHIATGCKDGSVRVWKVTAPEPQEGGDGEEEEGVEGSWGVDVKEWGRGDATVGKVSWNITGTILTVSSEDGRIRLYKSSYAGDWNCMGTFSGEAPAEGSSAMQG